ncbi:tetratricopeptide repeat protein [Aeoliella sp. ICT_H6.2]|uniref:Tetratricopeptide repeat protein n=1 Tax=Aeoliella straminimaris TaxID=2954799 RepID=A0A9X2FHG9_9BACT|nr:tetratricopeptide repeat protein [Aeoliella straminimaris]MCO6046879.1 tetratricopeptide repeat protein [Aeoliella straminimaris]
MATTTDRYHLTLHLAPRLGVALLAVTAMLIGARAATAQITSEALIGDAVSDPDAQRYSDIQEAIRRYQNKDVLGAQQFLEAAKRKDDRLPPADLMLAKLYFLSNQNESGLRALEITARDVPDDPEPYLLLADQANRQGQAVEALALYDKAIALTDKYEANELRKRKFVIRGRAGRSTVLQRWRDWEAAEKDIRAWIEADPDEANAHNRLGAVLFMQGREQDGYDSFTKAKGINDELPSPFVSAASMYQQLAASAEDTKTADTYRSKAQKAFQEAYKKNPNDETTLVAYSEWLTRNGKLDEAASVLTAARKAQPDSPQVALLSGVVAEMTGKMDEAKTHYNRTLTLAPGNRDASNLLALLLIDSEDSDDQARAEQLARINQQLNQNNADANITLAWVLRKRGNGTEANRAYQNGLRLGALNQDSSLIVAKLLAEQNRDDVARNILEGALKNQQGIFVHRNEAEALLAGLKK